MKMIGASGSARDGLARVLAWATTRAPLAGTLAGVLLATPVVGAAALPEVPDTAIEARLSDEQRQALDALRAFDAGVKIEWDAREAVPRALAGRLSAPSSAPAERIAFDFVRAHQDLFRLSNVDAELAAGAAERDTLDMSHVRLAQLHLGVPVFGGELRVHIDASGVVKALEAELLPAPRVTAAPALAGAAAVEAAVKHVGDGAATAIPSLVVFDPGRLTGGRRDERLSWRVELAGAGAEWVAFVDAVSGDVAFAYRNTHEARDREVRGYATTSCNLGTLYYNEAGPVVGSPPADATNAYTFGADVHAYYLGTHGRDSYDGAGARMVAVVQEPINNAQWSPSCLRTMFGTGYATKDVVAHEWQHAVTQFTANLVYSCQSGALNESMSDVFGAMIDRDDWLMGEDLPGGYIRSLADPTSSRPPQPDTNNGASQCAGVHTNSGIPNKVAYLVAQGGLHYGVSVTGLGKPALEQIWFRALRFHMGASTDFAGARTATINAATELFGAGSAAVCSVSNAWASVAVGSVCTPAANNAAFVSQSVPTTMTAGQSYAVSITLQNTGGTTWTTAAGYKLGSQNPQDNTTWGLNRVALPGNVNPGANTTFNFTVTAPSAPGSYNFQWRMVREFVEWFGALTPNVAVTVQAPANDNASFVSQSVPATMTAGKTYNVSVTMRNTGGTTWTAAAGYKLGSQNPQGNTTWGLNRVSVSGSVAPNTNHTFNFTVTAPSTPGTYNFQWRMLREGVAWFGANSTNVAVSVIVAAPSSLGASYNSTTGRIQLSWVDNNSAEDGTHLQFSYSGSAWGDLSPATVGANVTTWQSGPNPPTGSYQFRVRAFKGGVYSAWSNTASLIVSPAATASIAWIKPAEEAWGPAGTLTAAGFATGGSGGVQLVWRERGDNGVWGAWQTVAWQPTPAGDNSWSNTIASGNPTNKCHHFDAYVNYSGVTSPVFHYTGWTGCP